MTSRAGMFGAAMGIALAGHVVAQPSRWAFTLRTADGDELVEPGEVALVDVFVDLDPSVGEIEDTTGLPVVALQELFADFFGTPGWSEGRAESEPPTVVAFYSEPYVDQVTQDLRSLWFFQITTLYYEADPLHVLTIVWDPLGDYSPRRTGFEALARSDGSQYEDEEFQYFVGYDTGFGIDGDVLVGSLPRAGFTFQIVPAPAGAIALLMIAAGASRRRR